MSREHPSTQACGEHQQQRNWRLLCAGLLVAVQLLQTTRVMSQEFAPRGRNNLLTADNTEAVLMLNSGRVVTGKVRQVSTGYLVTSRSGYVAVPWEDVRFAANELSELYILQKRELNDPSVKERMQLAEWCFSQKLNSYAAKELLGILERDPSHEPARRLLTRIDDDRQRELTPKGNSPRDSGQKKVADDEARSLAGLTGATADQFATSVQPLLHNKCGNARCHGANSAHEFRLSRGGTGAGNHRLYAEKNLAAILKYVDLDNPQASRLLKVTQGAHGGQTVFTGRSGSDQQKLLKDWVQLVARELKPQSVSKSPSGVFAGKSSTPREVATTEAKSAQPTEATPLTSPESQLTESEKTNFRKVLEAAESDAFDPAEFNRKFATPGNDSR